jgi:hypothetical protein
MNLVELTERLHAIRDRNDWRQFHSPKNLAMAAWKCPSWWRFSSG